MSAAGCFRRDPARRAPGRLLRGPLGWPGGCSAANLAGWAFGFLVVCGAVGGGGQGHRRPAGTPVTSSARRSRSWAARPASTNAYLAAVMSLAGLAAAAYATTAVLRLRGEETALRAEPADRRAGRADALGGRAPGRHRGGTAVVLVAAGLRARAWATGCGSATSAGQLPAMTGAGLAQLPAALAVAGVAVLLTGLVPRWSVAGGWVAARGRGADRAVRPGAQPAGVGAGHLAVQPRAAAARQRGHRHAADLAGRCGRRAGRGRPGRPAPPRPRLNPPGELPPRRAVTPAATSRRSRPGEHPAPAGGGPARAGQGFAGLLAASPRSISVRRTRVSSGVAPRLARMRAAGWSGLRSRPSRMCSVPM